MFSTICVKLNLFLAIFVCINARTIRYHRGQFYPLERANIDLDEKISISKELKVPTRLPRSSTEVLRIPTRTHRQRIVTEPSVFAYRDGTLVCRCPYRYKRQGDSCVATKASENDETYDY